MTATSSGRPKRCRGMSRENSSSTLSSLLPRSAVLHAPPLDETAFLVRAAADPRHASQGWGDELAAVFAQLAATDRLRAGPLDGSGARPS